jgi:hypothetical protein
MYRAGVVAKVIWSNVAATGVVAFEQLGPMYGAW